MFVADPGRDWAPKRVKVRRRFPAGYIEQRRAAPGDDVMSRLANVRFPDGELPEVMDVVRLATILFAAG